ncbi:MAG: lytic transglycosylase domain-containing protein [Nitrospira sp.]|nr:lytic transglycosylase domain-containing protein [Nitrospira sp.]
MITLKNITVVLLLLLFTFICLHSDIYAFCFEEAGRMYNISPRLLWAIGKGESDFNPRAINWNGSGSYDFGVMQINSSWRKVIGQKAWLSLGDPCYNVKVGAWILSHCITTYGYTWEAVGCYNAKSKTKRSMYSKKIYDILKKYNLLLTLSNNERCNSERLYGLENKIATLGTHHRVGVVLRNSIY